MIAASPSSARCVPSDPGPSRSSSSAERREARPAAGRPAGASREPALLDQRPGPRRRRAARASASVAADVRPATSSSAAGSRARPRGRPRGARDRRGRRRRPRSGRRPSPPAPSRTRSSGPSRSKPSRQRARRSATAIAGDLGEPARQRVVAAEGPGGRRAARPTRGDRHDVGRVAVVGEGAPVRRPPPPRRTPGGRRSSRAGSRPSRGRPARPAVGPRRARGAGSPNGRSSGGPATIVDVVAPAAEEPAPVALRRPGPRGGEPSAPAGRRPGRARGWRMRTATGRIAASLASRRGRPVAGATGPGVHRSRGEPRRRRGDARAPASMRSPRLPGCRLRGVSRLYATEPVGRHRPARVPQRGRRARRPGRARPGDRRAGAARRAQGARARLRPAGSARAGARASSTSTCSSSGGRGSPSSDPPPPGPSTRSDPAKAVRLLVVPHPAADARLFVLAPLADLAPGLVPPGWGETVETARRRRREVAEGPRAVRLVGTWDARGRPLGAWRRGSAQVAGRQLGLDRLARPARARPDRHAPPAATSTTSASSVAMEDERGAVVGRVARRAGRPRRSAAGSGARRVASPS